MAPPYVRGPHKYNGLYGPGFIRLMTPGDSLPPPSRHIEPPFSVGEVTGGCRKNIHPGEDFPMRLTARPRMGGRRPSRRRARCRGGPRRDRPLMALWGAGRAHPLRGRVVTRLGSCADIGCRVSVNKSMDSGCQSGFRRNHQKSRSAKSCNDFAEFPWRKNATSSSRRTCQV